MFKLKIVLWLCLCLVSRSYSQSIYLANNDTLTCLTEKELDIVIGAFIDRDGCLEAYDTISVGYDALHSANNELEAINKTLVTDLEMSKAISQGLAEEKKAVEKQLKKKDRQNKFHKALLWGVSGVAVACMVLYLVK